MVKYKQVIAIALAAGLGIAASGAASAHGMQQGTQGPGGMMMGGQGGMGPGMMMGGQAGMGPGMMMGGQAGMGPGMMPCPMMANMGGMLDEAQLSSLREMRREHRSAQLERMGEMMNLRDDMMLLMQAERPDPEEVQALHGQMATLHGEMMADKVRMRNRMQDLLSDQQREELKQGPSSGNNPQ